MRVIGNDKDKAREVQFVASGTLSTGDAVIVKSDGTVGVSETKVGSSVVFEEASTDHISVAYDSNAQKW